MNLRLGTTKLVAAGVLTAVLVAGGASIAAAAGSTPAPVDASADPNQTDGEQVDGPDNPDGTTPSFTGSVRAPADTRPDGQQPAGGEAGEVAALQALATVSAAQAEQAALAKVPGTVARTVLESENGFVVYGVAVTGANGTVTDVKVDAGNGTVLAQETGEAAGPAGGGDQPEGPENGQG